MKSKNMTIFLCLLIVTAVFTAVVPGSMSAKPTEREDIEEEKPISIHVIWKDDGYYVIVTGPEGLEVYLVIIDHKGGKTHSEMKYGNGEYLAWISKQIAKNKNDIYIAIIDASEDLFPNDKGDMQALHFQVIDIDIKGKKDRVRLKTTTVLDSKLLLKTVYDDKGRTRNNKELVTRSIDRHSVRKGAGPGSFLDLTHTIEFQIPTPDFDLDSFFDVFYEIDFHPPEPGRKVDSFFDISYGIKSDDFTVDSFFDVFFEKSKKGTDFHMDSYIDVDEDDELEPIIPESFFDISIKTDFDLPYPGRLGGDFVADSFFDVFYEIDFLGNANSRDNTIRMRGGMESSLSGGAYHARRNTHLGMGSTRFRISDDTLGPVSVLNKAEGAAVERESFFDVFTELTLGLGPHEKGGDDNFVDSFFDVFTELSFHPGRTWIDPDGGVKFNSFFDVFTKLFVNGQDWDLVAIDDQDWDITTEDDWESPEVLTGSFFDVFASFEPEMFAETLPDDYFMYHIDSFFDVFYELIRTVPVDETRELQLDDTEPPEVIFTTPVRGSYVTGTAATLTGRATDLGGGIETIKIDSFNHGSLELGGTVDGSINENNEVSFDGSIELKNDVEKQFGESVKVGLSSGGGLSVKVEKNSFKGAELTGVVITASVKVSDIEFVLEGNVNGSINEAYEVSFDGSIELENDVEKEFGTRVKAGIAAGARIEINESLSYYSERTLFKGEVTYIEIPLGKEDETKVLIRAYDRLHRLTRGRKSRTWSDGEESNTIMESRFDCFAETLPDDIKYHCMYSSLNPEPSTDSFFDASVESGLDINFSSVATGPISPPPENIVSIDSFFDVFTETVSSGDGLYHIDSFFDVFVEIDDGQGSGGLYHIDSFFDVFTEIDLSDEVEFICAWNETLYISEGFEGGEFQVISLEVDADFAAPSQNDDNGDSDPPQLGYFDLEYACETLDGINQQIALLQTFSYSGIEMQKNNTTIAGDKYEPEPLHIYCYGTINLSLKYDPKSDASGDPPAMRIPVFELFHRLTRGTSSRTWDDGTTSVLQEVIWTTSTVTRWGDGKDDDSLSVSASNSAKICSQKPGFADSFFNISYQIEASLNDNEPLYIGYNIEWTDEVFDGIIDSVLTIETENVLLDLHTGLATEGFEPDENGFGIKLLMEFNVTYFLLTDETGEASPTLNIDSFFEITYDMDDDAERECPECGAPVGSDDETCPDCGAELPEGGDTSADSFFDVFFDVTITHETTDAGGELSTEIVSMQFGGEFHAEIVSMTLSGVFMPGGWHIGLEIETPSGDPDIPAGSFFDVFFDVTVTRETSNADGELSTEMVSMQLGGEFHAETVSMTLSGVFMPGGWHIGMELGVTIGGEDIPADSFFDVFVEIEPGKGQDGDNVSRGLSVLNLKSKTTVGEDEYYFLADDIRFPSGDLGDYWEFDSGEVRSSFGVTEKGFWYSSAVMIPHEPLPEQDDEVLVTFEHGDSNHPYDIDIRSLGKDLWVDFTPLNRSLFAEIHQSVVQISNSTGNYTQIHVFVDVYANETDESGNVEKVLLYTDLFWLNYSLIDVDSRSGSSSVREVMELVVDHAEYR